MRTENIRDVVGGCLLLLCGVSVVWHGVNTLSVGTLRNMGAGLFPAALGVILTGLGLGIALQALHTKAMIERIEIRSVVTVAIGMVAFALAIRPLGIIPAIVLLTLLSSLAERRFRPITVLVLCVVLPAFAFLVFRLGLGLPLPLFRYPF